MFKKYLLLLITGFIFGSQFLITKYALEGYTALEIGMFRNIFGMLALSFFTFFLPKKGDEAPISWFQYALIGFFEGALPCVLVPLGQEGVNSSIASVIISTMPIFVLLIAPFILKNEHYHWKDTFSVLLAFIGVFILVNPGWTNTWFKTVIPESAILLASMSWALSLILLKRLPHTSPFKMTRNILIAASIEIIIFWLIFGSPESLSFKPIPFLAATILGIGSSGFVYVSYILLIRLAGVNFASFSNYLVPVVGVILGSFFLQEQLTLHEGIGIALIIASLIFHSLVEYKLEKK